MRSRPMAPTTRWRPVTWSSPSKTPSAFRNRVSAPMASQPVPNPAPKSSNRRFLRRLPRRRARPIRPNAPCARSARHSCRYDSFLEIKRFGLCRLAGDQRYLRRMQRRAGVAEAVGDRITTVAAKIFQRHLHARCGLPAFIFGDVEHAFDARHDVAVEAGGDNRGDRLLAFYQALQNRIEHRIRRE